MILSGPIKPFLLDVASSKRLALKRFFDFVSVNLKDWQSSFGSFSQFSVVFSSIKESSIKEFYFCMVLSASSLSQVTIYCSVYSSKMILCIILVFFYLFEKSERINLSLCGRLKFGE